jgi:hypothetical protein
MPMHITPAFFLCEWGLYTRLLELKLELIHNQMAQKSMLQEEVYARKSNTKTTIVLISPAHKRTEGLASVWGSEFSTKAPPQEGFYRFFS